MQSFVHELFYVRERWAVVTNEALRDANIDARVDHRSLKAQGIDREPYPHIPRAAFEMERHGYRSAQAEHLRAEYQARVQARAERDARNREWGAAPWERDMAPRGDTSPRERVALRREWEAARDDTSPSDRDAVRRERDAAHGERDERNVRGSTHRDDASRSEREAPRRERDARGREWDAAPGERGATHAAPANAAPAHDARMKPQSLDDIRRQAREDWLQMKQDAAAKPAAAKTPAAAQERSDDDYLSR
jgi:hypothetical protein